MLLLVEVPPALASLHIHTHAHPRTPLPTQHPPPVCPLPPPPSVACRPQELTELNSNSDRLARSYNELLELQLVLERAGTFFEDARATADATRYERPPLAFTDSESGAEWDV